MNTPPKTVDEYIAAFPPAVQELLQAVRSTAKKAAPAATEAIKYGIPTLIVNGKNLVHYAAFKQHIGFYPTPNGIQEFEKDLSVYKQGKGSVQFPFGQPLPLSLITRIVKYRLDKK